MTHPSDTVIVAIPTIYGFASTRMPQLSALYPTGFRRPCVGPDNRVLRESVPMSTTRPTPHTATDPTRQPTGPGPRTTPLRPGALWRTAAGIRFRISREGDRIHYAQSHGRRNAVLLPAAHPDRATVPDHIVRALLELLCDLPPDTSGRRMWRVDHGYPATWALTLELRAPSSAAAQFPAEAPARIPVGDDEQFAATAALLREQSIAHERDIRQDLQAS